MRYALITGASTGIGRAISLELVRQGVSVFAGVRRDQDGDGLIAAVGNQAHAARLLPIELDVTRQDQIGSAFARIAEITANRGLWALVNNAGIVVPGPVEFLARSEWQKQFDVNFFGLIDVTRAALPLLRVAVAAEGRFVPRLMLVSSIGGRVAQPFLAPYTTSKWAVTSLGDSLRLELRRQGIGVTVLEPGAIATEIWGKGGQSAAVFGPDHPARPLYGEQLDSLAALSRKTSASAIPAEKAAQVAVHALLRAKPSARVLVGRDAQAAALLRKWLPLSWFDRLLSKQFDI